MVTRIPTSKPHPEIPALVGLSSCEAEAMADTTDIDPADTIANRVDPNTAARIAEYMRGRVDIDQA